MLDKIVKKSRSIVLAALVAVLSLVFVLQFGGPQAQGCAMDSTAYAARIHGKTITENDFQSAYLLAGGDRYPPQLAQQNRLKELVLYGLIERNLLASEARRLGLRVTEDDVMERIATDGILYVSLSVDAPAYFPSGARRFDFSDEEGSFDKQNLKRFIQYRLGRSIKEFTASQITETLAAKMRDVATSSVTVSDAEVWDAYVREQETAKLSYIRFSPSYFRDAIDPSEEELAVWMEKHAGEVDAAYQKDKHRYTDLEKQVRARHILIEADPDADEATHQAAREKAEALLKRAERGAGFAELAREHSDDTATAKKGGDLGYNPRGRMAEAFDEAMFALEPGELSDVVETQYGYHIIKAEDIREGDVPEREAKLEIAARLYRDARAEERARQAAEQALQALQQGVDMKTAARKTRLASAGAARAKAKPAKTQEGEEEADEEDVDPLAPQVRETRSFGRTDTAIPGPFDSTPLVQAALEMDTSEPLPDAPMQLGDDWFVYRLQERTHADREEFGEEARGRITRRLLSAKRDQAIHAYVKRLLQKARAEEAVEINKSVLTYEELS